MPFWPNLYTEVVERPYQSGKRHLIALSGYASAAFIHHLLYTYRDITIDLIIGMARQDPITIWDHNEYINLTRTTGRLRVRYFNGTPPIHIKALIWSENQSSTEIAFVGSANLSWNGFRDYQEMMVTADPEHVREAFPSSDYLMECTDPDVFEFFKMRYQRKPHDNEIDISAIHSVVRECDKVELPLTQSRDNEVHERAGLNWGQRPGREPNQAYIPVPIEVHRNNPNFFPDRGEEFTMITDDGESFICTIAQSNNKAIETHHDNSILGKYFRKRLGLDLGSKVHTQDLDRYGRKNVTIYKIDDETFYMDFSVRR
jgi:hypothetical protein